METMNLQIWKPAHERIEKIDKLIDAYREADKGLDDLTLGENCNFTEWDNAYEARNLAERTLKTAITNFAKFLGWKLDLKFDYIEKRIDVYEMMKGRVLRIAELLHEDDNYYRGRLEAIQ